MKRFSLVFVLCLSLSPVFSAFADFIPGRVRPLAVAEMQVSKASGHFAGMKTAKVFQNFEDGGKFVSLSVFLPRGGELLIPMAPAKGTSCGMYSSDSGLAMGDRFVVHTKFRDFSEVCEMNPGGSRWELGLELRDADGSLSVLSLEGQPTPIFVTF